MSATLLNRFGDKGITPIGASSLGCIWNTHGVNLVNIFLQLTLVFSLQHCMEVLCYFCMSFKVLLLLNISKMYIASVSLGMGFFTLQDLNKSVCGGSLLAFCGNCSWPELQSFCTEIHTLSCTPWYFSSPAEPGVACRSFPWPWNAITATRGVH